MENEKEFQEAYEDLLVESIVNAVSYEVLREKYLELEKRYNMYEKLGSVEEFKSLKLLRQPTSVYFTKAFLIPICPCCASDLTYCLESMGKVRFCPICGQAIHWDSEI